MVTIMVTKVFNLFSPLRYCRVRKGFTRGQGNLVKFILCFQLLANFGLIVIDRIHTRGGREGGRKGRREGGREGGREGRREGEKEGEREGFFVKIFSYNYFFLIITCRHSFSI